MFRPLRLPVVGLSLVLFLVSGTAPQTAQAGKVKVWHHHNQSHYDKAQFKQTVISSEGTLRLSRQVRPLAGLDATHVWDVVEDKAGNLFVATGDEGKLFKVSPDGKASLIYTSPDSQLLCLALAPDGTVFAGTGPSGLIVAVPPQASPRVFSEDLDGYVWSLVYEPTTSTLYAGTGPKGRIFQVNREGKASVFYATKQEHVLSLALGANDLLYAGTDKGGLVYRIDSRGKGFVLFQANQAEVKTLLVTSDAVYAGTSAPVRRRTAANASPAGNTTVGGVESSSSAQQLAKTAAKEKPPLIQPMSRSSSSASSSSSEETRTVASAQAPPNPGENSLYRIAADGTVRELFREKAMLLSLLRHNGRILVGTGMQGQLFEIDEASKERSELARLDHGQIHRLLQRRDGAIVLGSGDPGKLYVLEDKYATKGTVTSDVLDAKLISKWGALTWKANSPAGTSVSLAVRSGNVAEPDETWSDWSVEQSDPATGKASVPVARFFQYRVTLTSTNPRISPEFRGVAIRYATGNQAPEISSLEVPDLDAANLDNPKKLKVKWTATDANEDELTYNLYVRRDNWKSWVLIEEELEKKDYEWDTTAVPSGIYQVKVVASDRRDNSAEDALTGERISAPVAVAHTPPTVTVKVTGMEGEQAVVEASAADPLVRLTEASFAVNGKKWINVFPTDGLFDSKTETFRFKTEPLRPGTYVLMLRVRDAAGNVGTGDAVFAVRERAVQK
jgi:hypothetical protein